jgi:signal transduction histidine kinase/ActR/RegA family two-component response regulator
MARIDERAIAALSPRALDGRTSVDEGQVRFIIRAWLWALPILLVMMVMYVANGLHCQAVIQVITLASGVVLLVGLRWGLPLRVVTDGSLAVTACTFAAAALAQTPFDPSNIFFLSIVPLSAGFMGGFKRGAAWAVAVVGLGLGTIVLGERGFTWPEVDPSPSATLAVNFVFQIVLSLVFAKTYTEERERALHKALAADRAKSQFLANVSHEIRTPMNGVVGMTEVLLQESLAPAHRAQLEVIRRSGQSLVLLINDLLDAARLEEGRLELDLAPLDLPALVTDVGALYGALAAAKPLVVRVDLSPDLPRFVTGDALRLRQVLSNLLSNAVKFTAAGEVRLEVKPEGPRVRFAVVDTGPGIAPALRPRLFQRFEQGDGSATRRTGGTGLGLALSREFIARMGGTLEHDVAYAPGSRFTFALQLPAADAPVAQVPLKVPVAASPRRVLVVDDNPVNLAVARGLVGRAGHQVSTAANGREALEAVRSAPWGLVLMDLQMPEMDGLEATRQIRLLPGESGRVPIIALTASALPDDEVACRAAGMNELLVKPIDVRALSTVLERYLAA